MLQLKVLADACKSSLSSHLQTLRRVDMIMPSQTVTAVSFCHQCSCTGR